MAGTVALGEMSHGAAAPDLRTVPAYPVPEGQEAPEPSVSPEVSESIHKTSKNTPQACLVGESQAVRQMGGGGAITVGQGPISLSPPTLTHGTLTPLSGWFHQ